MKHQKGFTIIEILVVIVIIGVALGLFITQKATIDANTRDDKRKTAINAMYFNLEEAYYAKHSYYPQTIDSKTLRAMDPALFTDPNGNKLGDAASTYKYEATTCSVDGKCKHYRLSTVLEREADFVKTSRR